MKDLERLHYCLRPEVLARDTNMYLCQATVSNLVSHVGLTNFKISSTPLKLNFRLTPCDSSILPKPTLHR